MSFRAFRGKLEGIGLFSIRVAGVSFHTDNLAAILDKHEPEFDFAKEVQRVSVDCAATLVSEPDNPHDSNAIAVIVDDKKIGYLDREMASKLVSQLKRSGFDAIFATCKALLSSDEDSSGRRIYSARLDIATNKQKQQSGQNADLTDFEFYVDEPRRNVDPKYAKDGTRLKLWIRPTSPSEIFVSPDYDVFYEQKKTPLGIVPSEYLIAIFRHLQAGGEYHAALASSADGKWLVRGRLTPEHERQAIVDKYREERKARLESDLSKPYRPKKPLEIAFQIYKGSVRKGEQLYLGRLPSMEEIANSDGSLIVELVSKESGERFEISLAGQLVEKLVRLQAARGEVAATVSKGAAYDSSDIWVNLRIDPQ